MNGVSESVYVWLWENDKIVKMGASESVCDWLWENDEIVIGASESVFVYGCEECESTTVRRKNEHERIKVSECEWACAWEGMNYG